VLVLVVVLVVVVVGLTVILSPSPRNPVGNSICSQVEEIRLMFYDKLQFQCVEGLEEERVELGAIDLGTGTWRSPGPESDGLSW
jgi:hypothetical protein